MSETSDLIVFACPGCAKKLKVATKFAGRNFKCQACGERATVPTSSGNPVPSVAVPPPAPNPASVQNPGAAKGATKTGPGPQLAAAQSSKTSASPRTDQQAATHSPVTTVPTQQGPAPKGPAQKAPAQQALAQKPSVATKSPDAGVAAKRSVDARPAPALEDTFDPNDLFGAAGPIDESFGLDDMPAGAYATTAPDLDDMPVLGLSGGDLSGLDEMIAQTGVQVQQQIANAANARRLLLADVQKSITAPLPKRPPSAAYRVHLLMVATAMSLLPLLYVALVIAVGLGVVMYVIYGIPAAFSHSPRGRVGLLYALIVITPVIAGSILTLFMIKPLFFRIRSEGRRRSLTKQGEPMLFELVEKICEATGAPKPQRIDVDYQVNASASPQGGVFSAAAGKMVLTIGVPLLAGLSARQLAGVLAHEFGHFSQRMGMTTSIIIRKVNFWFARVVYQRDTFDETLDEWGQSEDWRIGLIVGVTKLCIMVSRGILWCFMMLGYLLSAGLMRQMEYDADRYEYGLVGHKTFRETAISLRLLSAAHAGVMDVMYQIFLKGHLADNMAMLSEHMMNTMPTDVREKLKRSVREEKTGLLDTHPSDQARIERAEQSGENGVFVLEVPARELLRHYEALCKNVTWDFYRDHLGNQIQPSQMTPTKQFVEALLRS